MAYLGFVNVYYQLGRLLRASDRANHEGSKKEGILGLGTAMWSLISTLNCKSCDPKSVMNHHLDESTEFQITLYRLQPYTRSECDILPYWRRTEDCEIPVILLVWFWGLWHCNSSEDVVCVGFVVRYIVPLLLIYLSVCRRSWGQISAYAYCKDGAYPNFLGISRWSTRVQLCDCPSPSFREMGSAW